MGLSRVSTLLVALAASAGVAACGGGAATSPASPPGSTSAPSAPTSPPSGATATPAGPTAPPMNSEFALPPGFRGETIASVGGARELATLPNGDLLVGTNGGSVAIVPNADNAGAAGRPQTFVTLGDDPAAGVAYGADGNVYVGTQHHVWKIPYHTGDLSEPASAAVAIANVRQIPDGQDHVTTSVAVTPATVYASVGSSCNACVQQDPTRATIQAMNLDGSNMHAVATRIRNAIAVTIDPATGTLWAAGAGQDGLPYGHPYEYADPVTLHGSGVVDYGWPVCEENHNAYGSGANCAGTVAPAIEFPAYATHVGAVFYPQHPGGAYAFGAAYRGGLFVTSHGSWHCCPSTPPSVDFVPMNGDVPATPVNWNDPTVQWTRFLGNLGSISATGYVARPTGVAVGPQGSLFIADDQNNAIYRIRPQ